MIEFNKIVIKELFSNIFEHGAWTIFVDEKYKTCDDGESILVNNKISLCTTVMNRSDDLIRSLPQNIEDNKDYPNLEFLILDYNSSSNELIKLINFLSQPLYLELINEGRLIFYRTEEPSHYSMSHSRNIAFKQAKGDIVVNVDADNLTNKGFASKINQLANAKPEMAIFAKGKRMLRGRLGFYKKEFIELLGGYNEDFIGYGVDDRDIMCRAFGLGFTAMCFGGKYFGIVEQIIKENKTINMINQNWKYTEKLNKIISFFNLAYGLYKANINRKWGVVNDLKSFWELEL